MAREILAGKAVEMLLPLLDKVGDRAESEGSERADENGRKVLALLREKLDERGRLSLDRLIANPGSRAWRRDLIGRIARHLEGDADSTRTLEVLALSGLPTAQEIARRRGQQGEKGQFGQEYGQQERGGYGQGRQGGGHERSDLHSDPSAHGSGGGRDD